MEDQDSQLCEACETLRKVYAQRSAVQQACETLRKVYAQRSAAQQAFFIIHVERSNIVLTDKKQQKIHRQIKKEILQRIGNIVCALRNTEGGVLLVHLNGHQKDDYNLEYFHEFVGAKLENLIEGGDQFTDVYRCNWLRNIEKNYENFHDVVYISVKKTRGLSTVTFNTSIRSDFEIKHPTTLNVVHLLSRKQYATPSKPVIRGIDDLGKLFECRNIELKAFAPRFGMFKNIVSDPKPFAEYIWNDLKLKDNVTSMSKISEGGSYYVGVIERKVQRGGYETKEPEVVGFELGIEKDRLKDGIYNIFQSSICVLHLNGKFDDPPRDLIEIYVHEMRKGENSKLYVLEVAIRYFDGIVFSDKEGPRCYIIEYGAIRRMTKYEWLDRTQRRLPPWSVMLGP